MKLNKNLAILTMKTQKLFWILISLIIFGSCEKENDEIGNDLELQKFWKLSGYYDSNGNQINVPNYNPDTLFYYEVNIIFLWNSYTQKYEIQGQGGDFSDIDPQNGDADPLLGFISKNRW